MTPVTISDLCRAQCVLQAARDELFRQSAELSRAFKPLIEAHSQQQTAITLKIIAIEETIAAL